VKPHDAGGDAFLYSTARTSSPAYTTAASTSTAFLNDISFTQNKLTAKIAQLKKLGTQM
jgi:hypothetical protein